MIEETVAESVPPLPPDIEMLPEPKRDVLFTVLILVPDTRVA